MSTSQNTQSTQDTAATSFTTTSDTLTVVYCQVYHISLPLRYLMILMSNVRINIISTGGGIMGRLDGIIELPMAFHENCVGPIVQKIASATIGARSNNAAILYFGYTSTRTPRTGKEADTSWRPVAKPPVNAGGSDPTDPPWPNLVVEVAYTQSESDVIKKMERYWAELMMALQLKWCNLTNLDLLTVMELRRATWQCVISIQLACLYHGLPANVLNPPPPTPPQLPPPNPIATIPNPISIDLFHVQFAILNCMV
ncbi:7636_t:CDS:2 [Rhizophagus irregularis]|nr:7636_t:CDS:2 [Rhizophagus irregularis]